jgi:hypothetical protein
LELVKLALDGHFHAIRYYLELRGTFADSDGGSGEGEDSEDEKEGTQILAFQAGSPKMPTQQ